MGLILFALFCTLPFIEHYIQGHLKVTYAAGKNDDNSALTKLLQEKEVAAFLAVADYTFNGNNPKAVTETYQELARKSKWMETVKCSDSKTSEFCAKYRKKWNKLPSQLAAVKGNTKNTVIAKQKTLYSNFLADFAAVLEQNGANGDSHDQNNLELASFISACLEAYINYHSNNDRNEKNDRPEPY